MENQIVLVDGRNFVFRHHFTHSGLSTTKGKPTSVLFGCLSGLLSLAKLLPDTSFVFVWDGGGNTWRHELLSAKGPEPVAAARPPVVTSWSQNKMAQSIQVLERAIVKKPTATTVEKIEGYKATRDLTISAQAKEGKQAAVSQIPEFMEVLSLLGIHNFRIKNLEGDDLIGILSNLLIEKKLCRKVIIHSNDKDFYQLMSPQVRILLGAFSGRLKWMDEDEIRVVHGVDVTEWVKYRAITGDRGDNIHSFITGVGPKMAVKWLAAGLDPSVADYRDLPYDVRLKMSDWKVPKIGTLNWPETWGRLHRNYLCSKILRDGKFGRLLPEVKQSILDLQTKVEKDNYFGYRKTQSLDDYQTLTEWLVKNEMADLLDRREELRRLF